MIGPLLAYFLQVAALTPAAPEPLSFQATLDAIRISGRPGQIATRQFRLTLDRNQRPTQFKARVEDWWRSIDGRQSFYGEPGTLQRSCSDWVSINPVESTVQPGETLTIRLTVTTPVEVLSGGFWCALTVDEVPNPLDTGGDNGVGVRFLASVSTAILVDVEPIERLAAITAVELEPGVAHVAVRNDGNCPVVVEGRLEFLAPDTNTPVWTTLLPRRIILTEPTRVTVLDAVLPSEALLPSGRYRVRVLLDFGADYYIGAEQELDVTREGLERVDDP